jgi:pyruvate,water dikinase
MCSWYTPQRFCGGVRIVWSRIKEIIERIRFRKSEFLTLSEVFEQFQGLLQSHQRAMELIADLGEKSGGDYIFDRTYLFDVVRELQDLLLRMANRLNLIGSNQYSDLYPALDRIFLPIEAELRGRLILSDPRYVISLTDAAIDNPKLIGGKANALAEIIHRTNIPVPMGFVITNSAYRRFLEYNDLEERIHEWLESWVSGKENLRSAASRIRYSILAGIVPRDVAGEIERHLEERETAWVVRSSAYGEDGELSFAGLHETVVNVRRDQVQEAYKKVLASLYSERALSYRERMGMVGQEAAMAVLCQQFIPSASSGVIQTVYGEDPASDCLAIYASFGLGRAVADGLNSLDRYVVSKKPPHATRSEEVASKTWLVRAGTAGGEVQVPLDLNMQTQPAVSQDTIDTLVRWALALERFFKQPQEVEWAADQSGRCWLLQSRPLVISRSAIQPAEDVCETCAQYPILIMDEGMVAHTGVGSGPVKIIRANQDMEEFPEGAVLVSHYTAPWLAPAVPKAAALITERGSAAGHLATLAREFRVPALVDVPSAIERLRDGLEITLDTNHRRVYEGRVEELLFHELVQSTVFEDSVEFRILRRLLKRVAPLHLLDPQSPDFKPEGCVSVHDLIRFIHEKAVQELMDVPALLRRFKRVKVWTLLSEVPMGLKILDLGGGIDEEATGDRVRVDQIRSQPLSALWEGISQREAWSTEPVHIDFRGLMASLTRNWDAAGGGATSGGFNLAVVNESYMNLHLRLGYHFNLVDARMDEEPEHNQIYFRFVGGVTDITRRSRRARVLAEILSRYNFNAATKDDLIVARLRHLGKEEIRQRLKVLGALIGFSRQLDIRLRNDSDIGKFVDEFFDRHSHLAQTLA